MATNALDARSNNSNKNLFFILRLIITSGRSARVSIATRRLVKRNRKRK
jgi:hypothetical protein